MNSEHMIRAYVSPDLKQRVRKAAFDRGLSISALIGLWMAERLATEGYTLAEGNDQV